jgi:hypothetical protein
MSIAEASALLDARMQKYKSSTYEQLLPLLNRPTFAEGVGPSGAAYRMEVSVFWEKMPYGNLRVFGLIDALYDSDADSPVTQTFLVGPEE